MRRQVHVFPTLELGGAQRRTARLLEALDEGLQHVIVTLDGSASLPVGLFDARPPDRVLTLPKMGSIATTRRLRSTFLDLRPDTVWTYSWGAIDGLIANRLATRARAIHVEEGFRADEAQDQKLRRVMWRRLVLSTALVVAVPSKTLEAIAIDEWRVPRERLRVLRNGVDLRAFGPGRSDRSLFPADPSAVWLGAVGRLARVKNFGRAVKALARLRGEGGLASRVQLLVAGEGGERADLVEQARLLGVGDAVHFVGPLRDVGAFMRCLDVFLLTSDSEQVPIALLEAMACGLPVVATAVGDVPKCVPESQRKRLVKLASTEATVESDLHAALMRLVGNPELRLREGRANRDHAEAQHGLDRHIAGWAALAQ